MICIRCGCTLKGLADTQMIAIGGGKRATACRDIDACDARKAENERRRTSGDPDPKK